MTKRKVSPVSDVKVNMSDEGGRRVGPLSLDECRCPVCLEIFLEPVTLPCLHTFCKGCFLESVDKAALSCPLCRRRVSTWARVNSKNNTLVNEQLWQQIQTHFPQQCERRRSGQGDEDDLGVSVCVPTLSRPGELQQEYQDQVTKMTEEKRALDEEQRRASEAFIQRLLAEEQAKLREEEKRREDDERLARQLSSELNATPISSDNLRPAEISAASRKKEVVCGQIEKFFPRPSKPFSDCSSASTLMSNKENILSDLDHHEPTTNTIEVPHRSQLTAPTLPTKRRSSELEATDDNEAMAKRSCHSSSFLQGTALSSQGEAEWEAELMSRRRQEEEDRHLALLLQKELDQEEKRKASDRSKGSADAYLLRQNREERVEPGNKKPNGTSGGPSKTSSSSKRRSKQTTLIEMFSSR